MKVACTVLEGESGGNPADLLRLLIRIFMNAHIAPLSPAQVNILDMMSFIKTPKAIDELNDILSDYFSKRLDEEINKLWTEGALTENKVESFRHLHERTTYPY